MAPPSLGRFLFAAVILMMMISIVLVSADDDNNILNIPPYKEYHVDLEFLQQSQSSCTTYVFPGVAYCNFIFNQYITVDMPPMNPSDKQGSDGVQVFMTPKLPVSSIPSYKYLAPKHMNYHNGTQVENIFDVEPEIITYDNSVNPPVKLSQLKFNYYKNFTNPQRFEISIQVMGMIKYLTNSTVRDSGNRTEINTLEFPLINNYTVPFINESGVVASIHFPYQGLKSSGINVVSPSKYKIHAINGTLIYLIEQSAEEILKDGVMSPFSVRFLSQYPQCDVMLTPTIAMWATTGTISVLTLLVVSIKGVIQIFQTKSRRDGYNPQTDY
ncbi:hypothetical protein C9374_009187 [Naegleria lovaniensis]|uniref:Uncharacterized protein n=1 Tax=Naegleria lovaniensis TaxID=51637 RepID=A0AA88GI82_NAELO|nr:uncharacterized protein C9374_009187 [Naegleria lovaniensis]KAG2377671.1 hypothetical protein C9374_009187 [Naegleria lovaniensis]